MEDAMTVLPRELKNCPAPAKLNLFLHVVGQRADGYHLLESAFQLIDRADVLHFTVRHDAQIIRTNDLAGVPAQTDLVVRAAQLLQRHTGCSLGADITLEKKLPMGGGLGGGSSDAATVLMVLNHLWQTQLSRQQLMQLGLQLGADVPFFLFGQNAFAQGIGEQLVPITTPDCWYVVIEPGVHVPTQAIFSSQALTRNSPSITVSGFQKYPHGYWKNDLQDVATQLFPEISLALSWLSGYGNAKMTGSGSCVFCACSDEVSAAEVVKAAQATPNKNWTVWAAKALQEHPCRVGHAHLR
jgi:4-diphosphocytidyl-2-C-methyl-D-erythritol kinase